MYSEIICGDGKVPMRANAATPIRYRQIWGADLLQWLEEAKDLPDREVVDGVLKLGYVMSLQAEAREDPGVYDRAEAQGEAGYIDWLDRTDLGRDQWPDVLAAYTGQTRGTVEKKRTAAPPTGR
jgi:hypothetical protein